MLNGLDPILLINLKTILPSLREKVAKIPVLSSITDAIGLPPIPIYLSERQTGLFVDTQSKNVDIDTQPETNSAGETPGVQQKGLSTTVRVNMVANKNSLGLILLSALIDIIFEKVTSKEYSITYLSGSVVVIGGLLHSFSVDEDADNDLLKITMEITNPALKVVKAPLATVANVTGATP